MLFVPIWDSILDSLKMHRLSPELVGKWTWLLACAQRHDRHEGTLPDVETLAFWLRRDGEEIREWLKELVAAKLVDRHEKTYAIHDWSQWRCSKDKTAKERMKRMRERRKNGGQNGDTTHVTGNEKRNGDRNVTAPVTEDVTHVTPPVTPLEENDQRSFASLTHAPPACAGEAACVREDEPFEPGENPELPAILVIPWTPEEQRVVDRATQRWGANFGDVVVGDLLRDYPAGLVSEACEAHFAKVQQNLHPGRLRGLCRTIWDEGRWKPSTTRGMKHEPPVTKIHGLHHGP